MKHRETDNKTMILYNGAPARQSIDARSDAGVSSDRSISIGCRVRVRGGGLWLLWGDNDCQASSLLPG